MVLFSEKKKTLLPAVHLPGNPSRCAITAGDPSVRLCSSAILACKSAWGHQGQKQVNPHPHELNSPHCLRHIQLYWLRRATISDKTVETPLPSIQRWGGTTLHGGYYGGKAIFFLYFIKTLERPFRANCLNHFCHRLYVFWQEIACPSCLPPSTQSI